MSAAEADRRVRWGIIGTASIARKALIPAIRASANGELVAVASRAAERARAFAGKADVPVHFGSYDALLNDERIDAVYNPLPNSLHREWTIRAAERGKHILCEKPLALDASECREMEAAASANGVRLMEAFMYRFHPRTERVLEMVRSGAVGRLESIRSSFTFRLTRPADIRWDPRLGGGALMDVGCYCVNISRTVAGREPVGVSATARFRSGGVDDRMTGTLRFDDGLRADFECSLSRRRSQFCRIEGSGGRLSVPDAFLPGAGNAIIDLFPAGGGRTRIAVEGADQYRLMVEHFAESIRTGSPVRYAAAESASNMSVIEALYESARRGGDAVAIGA